MILECNCLRIPNLKNIRMKKIGVALISASLTLGSLSDYLSEEISIEPIVGFSFGFFLMGIYLLIISKDEIFRS